MLEKSLMQSLQSRVEDLESLLKDLKEIQRVIYNCSKVIDKIDDPDLKRQFALDARPQIDEYYRIMNSMKGMLESHFQWETATGQPMNFSYRKFYKDVIKGMK